MTVSTAQPGGRVIPLKPRTMATQTGFAKTLDEVLQRKTYGYLSQGATLRFMSRMRALSFSRGGYARDEGDPLAGLRARFDLGEWAEATDMSRAQLLRLRDTLVERRILAWQSDGPGAGKGWLVWQTETEQWQTNTHGGKREGAGRKAGQAAIDNLIKGQAAIDNLINPGGSDYSSCQRNLINLSMAASSEAGNQAGSAALLRMEEDIDIPDGISTASAAETIKKSTPARSASAKPKPKAAKGEAMTQDERDYRAMVLQVVADLSHIEPRDLPERAAQWGAAGRFFRSKATVEEVAELWAAEKASPAWDTRPLTLMTLFTLLGAWRSSGPKVYAEGVHRKRLAARGELKTATPTAGPARQEPATRPPTRRRTFSHDERL